MCVCGNVVHGLFCFVGLLLLKEREREREREEAGILFHFSFFFHSVSLRSLVIIN